MRALLPIWSKTISVVSNPVVEAFALLLARIALGLIFWRSYKTKVVEGTWLEIDPTQYIIFANEFTGLPLSPDLAVPLTVYAEFLLPILLFVGLFSRFAALGLAVMALVIQIFVFPTWAHFFGWDITVLGLAAIVMVRGPGLLGLDHVLNRATTDRTV